MKFEYISPPRPLYIDIDIDIDITNHTLSDEIYRDNDIPENLPGPRIIKPLGL